MEILPFIKEWMPEITILKPEELKREYVADLQKALQKATSN